MKDKAEKIKGLAVILREACKIYEELMVNAESEIERRDWAIDADAVETASAYASQEAASAA